MRRWKGDSHEDKELQEPGFVSAVHNFAEDDGNADAAYERKRDPDGDDAECFSTAPANGVEIKLQTHKEEGKKKAYAGYRFKRGHESKEARESGGRNERAFKGARLGISN